MSYMGPRYFGGQIFPQGAMMNQNQPNPSQHFRNMQQQLQMVQMHLQKQNIPNQTPPKINQNQQNSTPKLDNDKNKGAPNANSSQNSIPNASKGDQSKNNKTQQDAKPQSQHEQNQNANKNKNQGNLPSIKPENQSPNKGPDNAKGQMKSRFGNNPEQEAPKQQPQQQQQQNSMNQPQPLMGNLNIMNQRNMNQNFNAPNEPNPFENQDPNKQNFKGSKFGKGPMPLFGNAAQNQRNLPQHQYEQDNFGRNDKSKGVNAVGRQGGRGRGGGHMQHSSPQGRGPSSKGHYYGTVSDWLIMTNGLILLDEP